MTQASTASSGSLCALEQIPDGGALGLEASVDGEPEPLLLLRRGDEVHAFFNVCPHAGRRLDWAPDRFLFSAGNLVCAAHGAVFSVPDGHCVGGPCRGSALREVPVEVRGAQVYLAGA